MPQSLINKKFHGEVELNETYSEFQKLFLSIPDKKVIAQKTQRDTKGHYS